MHMTIALGIIDHFVHHPVKHDLLFLFQPAEEGPGGAAPMLESDVLKKWTPDLITALHIAPELPVGTISTKSGLLFANTSELVIDLEGKADMRHIRIQQTTWSLPQARLSRSCKRSYPEIRIRLTAL